MSLLLALLAQVGPFSTPQPVSPLPPEIRARKAQSARTAPAAMPSPPASDDMQQCMAGTASDPLATIEAAESWLARAQGSKRAEAGQCLGMALSRLQRWDEAGNAFVAARDAAAAGDNATRARLGAMAGSAALARGDAAVALDLLDAASGEADLAGELVLNGDIELDRARALVALNRPGEADAAFSRARSALPGNAEAWLLSATLSRRLGRLGDAQTQIEKAAELLPVDPEIGLEAGVIAILSGREQAARRSWQSVVAAAPDSPAATTARGYLAQIDGN